VTSEQTKRLHDIDALKRSLVLINLHRVRFRGTFTKTMDRISWDKIDKFRFYGYGTVLFCGLTASLYPLFVVKTQMQVQASQIMQSSSGSRRSILSTVRSIVLSKGVGGLWRGQGTVLVGEIPTQTIYVTVLEVARQTYMGLAADWSDQHRATFASAASGATACMCAQVCIVPTDVISQRQIVASGVKRSAMATARVCVRYV